MRYTQRTKLDDIKNQYKEIIAWGTGTLFITNYKERYYDLAYIIDGTGKGVGKAYRGYRVEGEEILDSITEKTLIVIYTIYEKQVIEQIGRHNNENIDMILFSLLDIDLNGDYRISEINGKQGEDVLLLQLFRQLDLSHIKYMEIGVCHPIVRNNTYMLYENFANLENYHGVLVEANPLCWDLIQAYRPKDILVKAGASNRAGTLWFYAFPDLLGHSTFIKEIAESEAAKGYQYERYQIPVIDINQLLNKYCDNELDLLAIDAEGLDETIIASIDFGKNDITCILYESALTDGELEKRLKVNDYTLAAKTQDNAIWVKREKYH